MDSFDWIDDLLPELADQAEGGRLTIESAGDLADGFPVAPEPDPLGEDGSASDQAGSVLDDLFSEETPLALRGGGNPPARIKDPADISLTLPQQALDNGLGSRASEQARDTLADRFSFPEQDFENAAAVVNVTGGVAETAGVGPCVPIIVTNTNDSGAGSLRQAILDAEATVAADTITFAASLAGGTIVLTLGDLDISTDITINGDTNGDLAADITISGDADGSGTANAGDSRIFNLFDGNAGTADVTLQSLTLTGGYSAVNGGGIYAAGISSLTVEHSTVRDSTAGFGGGIFAYNTTLDITGSTLFGNSATDGGGIYSANSTTTLTNTTVHGNTAAGFGGGVSASGATDVTTINNSTITGNRADADGNGSGTGARAPLYALLAARAGLGAAGLSPHTPTGARVPGPRGSRPARVGAGGSIR